MHCDEITLSFPEVKPELYPFEREALRIRPRPLPVDWLQENIRFVEGAYNSPPGKWVLRIWQHEPINAFVHFPKVIYIGPTQTGKSLFADGAVYYSMAVLGLHGMMIYNNTKTVSAVFSRRIKPMILGNKVLRDLWSGKDDDLSIMGIKLRNCFWGVASCVNRDDLATWPAGCVVWSEASKSKPKNYDVQTEITGRQGSYALSQRKEIIETSPNETGDLSYKEVYKLGSKILMPHIKCPHCSHWQVLQDSGIKLRSINGEEPDHDPSRIRIMKEKAAWYPCPNCGKEIDESYRVRIFDEEVVWAAPKIVERVNDKYTFTQEAEEIAPDGSITYDRDDMLVPVFNWNRLVNPQFPFWECLARFFESRRSTETFHTYLNNDMARYFKREAEKLARTVLEAKALQSKYFSEGENAFVPDDVLVVVLSMDTQDKGFWYMAEGFGENGSRYVLRCGWIDCDIELDQNENLKGACKLVTDALFSRPFQFKDGRRIGIMKGFIDRGGHRSELVDYICDKLLGFDPYIGDPRFDTPGKEMVYDTGKGWFFGKTELLSYETGTKLSKRNFHLPHDISQDFFNQVLKQYQQVAEDKYGNEIKEWVHGGEDHLRDCMNMNTAASIYLGLGINLFDPVWCADTRQALGTGTYTDSRIEVARMEVRENQQKQSEPEPETERPMPRASARYSSSYFGRGRF